MAEWMLTEDEVIAEASKDSTYCQLSVDVGMWASKAQVKKMVEWLEGKIVKPLPDSINGRLTMDLSPADIIAIKEVLGE